MNCLSHKLFSLFILTSFVVAQNDDIIELTKHIGFTLDAEENKYYEIFKVISNFDSAQFFQFEKAFLKFDFVQQKLKVF